MAAEWSDAPVMRDEERVSYVHPNNFSMSDLKIISVCGEHDSLRKLGVEVDPYPDYRGYIKRPIPDATEAESLYVHLYRYSSRTLWPATCDCRINQRHDRFEDTFDTLPHPVNTRKCQYHTEDDDKHSAVFSEMKQVQDAIAKIQANPGFNAAESEIRFAPTETKEPNGSRTFDVIVVQKNA